jgi:hypothetical protein
MLEVGSWKPEVILLLRVSPTFLLQVCSNFQSYKAFHKKVKVLKILEKGKEIKGTLTFPSQRFRRMLDLRRTNSLNKINLSALLLKI